MPNLSDIPADARQLLDTPLGSVGGAPITAYTLVSLLVVVAIVWLLATLVERLIRRRLHRDQQDPRDFSVAYSVGRLVRYGIWIIGTMIGLQIAGLDLSSFALLGGAIGVGLGFGLQNIVSNFVSGVILLVERSLKVGDFVDLQSGVRGHVREIALRFTRVTTNDNVDVLVPNSEFINGRVTNWTYGEANRRLRIPFGVAYGSDKELVREAGLAAARRVEGVLDEPESRRCQVRMAAFGDSSLDFELLVWVDRRRLTTPSGTEARLLWALDDELRARGIEVPFPQRDLHLRSGTLRLDQGNGTPDVATASSAQNP